MEQLFNLRQDPVQHDPLNNVARSCADKAQDIQRQEQVPCRGERLPGGPNTSLVDHHPIAASGGGMRNGNNSGSSRRREHVIIAHLRSPNFNPVARRSPRFRAARNGHWKVDDGREIHGSIRRGDPFGRGGCRRFRTSRDGDQQRNVLWSAIASGNRCRGYESDR